MTEDDVPMAELKAENAALRAEIAALRGRPETVEQQGPELRAAQEALRESQRLLAGLMGNLPGLAYRCNHDADWTMSFISEGCRELTGYTEDAFLHPNREERVEIVALTHIEDQARTWNEVQDAIRERRRFQLRYRMKTKEGVEKWVWEQGNAVYAPDGTVAAIEGFITDISAQVRAEEDRKALQEQIIATQQDALRELATPLIPLAEGVLAMPLIGKIDRARAEQILETLLDGITSQQATTAILDITGVRSVDEQVASALVKTAQAARLLGTRVLVTGIRPDVAQMLVDVGADLGDIETRSTLQSAVTTVLQQRLAGARPTAAGRLPTARAPAG